MFYFPLLPGVGDDVRLLFCVKIYKKCGKICTFEKNVVFLQPIIVGVYTRRPHRHLKIES